MTRTDHDVAPAVNADRLVEFLTGLLNTPSPTGFTAAAVEYTRQALADLALPDVRLTNKGALLATVPGRAATRLRGVTAHVDTLGAMVKEIKGNGRLRLTQLGGYAWQSIEGEGCTIFTAPGGTIRGTIQCVQASVHIFGQSARDLARKEDTMEVRIDARTQNAADTRALGIEVGDFVVFDPRVETSPHGFVRSRHLDDKAGVACIVEALRALHDAGLTPAQHTTVLVSNYEEVGHGASAGWPPDLCELLTVDMAAVGEGQNSDEFSAGLCIKDSGGPYSHTLTRKLAALAAHAGISLRADIYPYYGSDGEALWRAGADVEVGLIGPGVEASHGYERTHVESLAATTRLIMEWMTND
jgi:putative aminopeptidase FrvX